MMKRTYIKPDTYVLNIPDGDSLLVAYSEKDSVDGNPDEIDSKKNNDFVSNGGSLWDDVNEDAD